MTSGMAPPAVDVVIASCGAVTSIGLDAPMTAASARCGITRFAEDPDLRDDTVGDPVVLALLETLNEEATAAERMRVMALEAAREALRPWLKLSEAGARLPPLPVLLVTPAPRAGFDERAQTELAEAILQQLPVPTESRQTRLAATGHAGALCALAHATELLRVKGLPACLLGGTESPRDAEYLHALDGTGRLKREGQPHGFTPGEGSGFVLLCTREFATRHAWTPLAEIAGVGQATEPRPWYEENAPQGQGLTQAFWQALRPQGGSTLRADVTYCDLNGETWRSDEWVFAYLRTGKYHGEPLDLRHPADCWGDTGAATGPLLLGLASLELARGKDGHETALVWAASDVDPSRAACLLRRCPRRTPP